MKKKNVFTKCYISLRIKEVYLKDCANPYTQSFLIFFDTKLEPTEKIKMEETQGVYLEQ